MIYPFSHTCHIVQSRLSNFMLLPFTQSSKGSVQYENGSGGWERSREIHPPEAFLAADVIGGVDVAMEGLCRDVRGALRRCRGSPKKPPK